MIKTISQICWLNWIQIKKWFTEFIFRMTSPTYVGFKTTRSTKSTPLKMSLKAPFSSGKSSFDVVILTLYSNAYMHSEIVSSKKMFRIFPIFSRERNQIGFEFLSGKSQVKNYSKKKKNRLKFYRIDTFCLLMFR